MRQIETHFLGADLMFDREMTRRDFLRGAVLGVAGLTVSGRLVASESASRRNPIIYFTKFLRGLTPGEVAEIAKRLGFDGLDLAVRRGQAVNPANVRDALPAAMKIWEKAGLSVPMVSTETGLTDPQDRTVEPIWAACAETGVRNIKIGYWPWKEGESYSKSVDQARRDLERFSKVSEKHRVRTLVHNHSGPYLACNASTLMTLLRDSDPAWVGAYMDPAHLAVNGEPLPLALEIVGDHLAMIAVKNVAYIATESAAGTTWSRKWCLLRDGLVDWPRAIELLRGRGYDGPLSLHGEYSGPEERDAILKNVAEDVKYLISISSVSGVNSDSHE
jgi:sugar phosphate isomerase/epimerase